MSSHDGAYTIPVGLDLDQLTDDLAKIDKAMESYRQKLVNARNQSAAVRSGRAAGAERVEDIPESAYTPHMRRIDEAMTQRFGQLRQSAAGGHFTPPPTVSEQARQNAQQRLTDAQRQMKPTVIEGASQFWDKFKQTLKEASPADAAMSMARGNFGAASSEMARVGLGALVDNPIGLGVAATGALAYGALRVQGAYAGIRQEQATVGAELVHDQPVDMNNLSLQVQQRGLAFNYDSGTSLATANTLAQAGVSTRNLPGTMENTFAASRLWGLKPSEVAPVMGQMATAGGLNKDQITQMIQDISNAAGDFQVPATQMLASLKALSQVSTNAAKDVTALAEIQKTLGPSSGMNAGSLMSGVMGQVGQSALQTAAMLGMDPTRFAADQNGKKGGMLDILRHAGTYAQQFKGAPPEVMDEMLGKVFGQPYAQLDNKQRAGLRADLTSGSFDRAYHDYFSQAKRVTSQRQSPHAFLHTIRENTADQTPILDSWGQNIDFLKKNLIIGAATHPQDVNTLANGVLQFANLGSNALWSDPNAGRLLSKLGSSAVSGIGQTVTEQVSHDLRIVVQVESASGLHLGKPAMRHTTIKGERTLTPGSHGRAR